MPSQSSKASARFAADFFGLRIVGVVRFGTIGQWIAALVLIVGVDSERERRHLSFAFFCIRVIISF